MYGMSDLPYFSGGAGLIGEGELILYGGGL